MAGDENSFLLGGTGLAACVATCLGIFVHSGNLFIDFGNDLCFIYRKREQDKLCCSSFSLRQVYQHEQFLSLFNRYLLFQRHVSLGLLYKYIKLFCILMPYFHVRLQVHYTGCFS